MNTALDSMTNCEKSDTMKYINNFKLECNEAMMMEYRKIKDSEKDKYIERLLKLSKAWADENSCPAYYENEPGEFINHEVYIATDNNQIIAYALGNVKELEEKTSYNEVGEKAFELDEIYVAANYRDKGIGKALYKFIEEDVRDRVDVIGVIATSYEYKKLLKFYIEDLNMNFNHALLVKRMD